MKVLAFAAFPPEAAATRYRLVQFVAPLRERGIELTVRPFLDARSFAALYRRSEWPKSLVRVVGASLRRVTDVVHARDADVLLVQREAALLGPPVFEWLSARSGQCPLVLDLDDPTWVSYVSPTYSHLARWVKWPGKTDQLISWAAAATCGNRTVVEYVAARGTPAHLVPTVVDPSRFTPRPASRPSSDIPIIGWIGSHSTYPYLASLGPVLRALAASYRFRLKVVGSGRDSLDLPGLDVENLPWAIEREIEDFQSLDIGLYPIVPDAWSVGKSGFKSIQYMACGVPFVASPVGAAGELGEPGTTHLLASSPEEWHDALARLLDDVELRRTMGLAGRAHVLSHYSLDRVTDSLETALRSVR